MALSVYAFLIDDTAAQERRGVPDGPTHDEPSLPQKSNQPPMEIRLYLLSVTPADLPRK